MRKTSTSLTLFAILLSLTAAADSASVAPSGLIITHREKPLYHKDRVIVQMKASSSRLKTAFEFQKSAEANGLVFERTIAIETGNSDAVHTGSAYALMRLDPANESVENVMARLQNQPEVEFVQPDYIYHASAIPNDPDYGMLWGLKNTAQTIPLLHASQDLYSTANPGTASRDMGLETAWNTVTDCSSVVVAVIDTGMDLDHDELKDNLWTNGSMQHGYDFVNSDTDPTDDYGHGTHVAGIIGARGNNGALTTGVCWRAQMMALKVLGADGSGSSSNIIAAVNFARTNGAQIVNMSLGGAAFDQLTFNAIKTASDAGILFVAAAGNDGLSTGSAPTYPCNYEIANVICVGAVDQNFARASFSNYSTVYVDIGAPGTNIVSTMYQDFGPLINIPLTAGTWTLSTANFAFSGGYLQNPSNWNGSTSTYTNNQSDIAYTSVDLSGTIGGLLIANLRGASQSNADYLSFWERGAGGDPVTLGTKLLQVSGSTSGSLATVATQLSSCSGQATCAIGFKFTSNASTTGIGYRVESLNIEPNIASTSALDSYNGTSMATPHIAGLAALVKASNPAFTAADLKNAILLTGTTTAGLTSSFKYGSVANAPAALKYVDAPLGVAAAVVP